MEMLFLMSFEEVVGNWAEEDGRKNAILLSLVAQAPNRLSRVTFMDTSRRFSASYTE